MSRENDAMAFREIFLDRFRWVGGHADVLGLLADGAFLGGAAEALAGPFRASGVTKVAGIEARGFILGAAVALDLAVGFVPIRKEGAIHPGAKAVAQVAPDWRGEEPVLQLQRAVVAKSDRVLLVDDWVETGNQALAARGLIEECGAAWVGLTVLVDQAEPTIRDLLEPLSAVARSQDLPPSVGG